MSELGRSPGLTRLRGDLTLTRHRLRTGEILPLSCLDGADGILACITLGDVVATADGMPMILMRGDIAVYDLSTTFTLSTDRDSTWITLLVPRTLLTDRLAGPPGLAPFRVPGEIVSAVHMRAYLMWLWRAERRSLPHGMEETALDLLMSAIEQGAHHTDSPEADTLRRLLGVAAHLRDGLSTPGFDPKTLARRAGLTEPDLSRLLAPLKPVELIRRARLVVARRTLRSAAGQRLSVAEIGCRVGMNSPAHFTTSYGQAFGAPPAGLRLTA